MGGRTARDLTTGPLGGHVLALAWPAILSTLVHNLYGINDVFFAQYAGLAGQTAISNNLFVMITIFGFIQLSAIGTMTVVARRTGARNEDGADRAARQGLFFGLAVSIVIATAGLLTAPWIPRLMGMAPDVTAESLRYLRVLFLGMPALFLFPTIESIFRARGDTRTPLLLQVTTVGTNIVGNALVVFAFDAGVAGIAVATILSRLVGVGLGLALLRGGRIGLTLERRDGPFCDLALWRRLALVSAPIGTRTMMFGFVYQVVSGITADFGTAAQNGLGVGIRAEGLVFFVLVGFGLAAGPLVGQNLGAGRPERAERAAWLTVGYAMVPSLVFTILFLVVPGVFMDFLTDDAATIVHGNEYLRIVAICFVFMCLEVVLANAFTGAGDTLPPMVVDVPLTALRIPLAWWLAHSLGWGPHGIWWAISWTAIARGVGLGLWFRRNRWKRSRPDLDQ
jgi:putative MATE family efflux protein